MVGRFIGAGLLKLFAPGKVLALAAASSVALLVLSAATRGEVSGYALIAVGLCNSIMYPTIFALACDGLGSKAADGSGILCVAIVGGAILPPLSGWIADLSNLRTALAVPAVAYLLILLFGLFATKPVDALEEGLQRVQPSGS